MRLELIGEKHLFDGLEPDERFIVPVAHALSSLIELQTVVVVPLGGV
jgi:hypothetical protein